MAYFVPSPSDRDWQLPLEPAFACTTHKMQGATAKYGAAIEP